MCVFVKCSSACECGCVCVCEVQCGCVCLLNVVVSVFNQFPIVDGHRILGFDSLPSKRCNSMM